MKISVIIILVRLFRMFSGGLDSGNYIWLYLFFICHGVLEKHTELSRF